MRWVCDYREVLPPMPATLELGRGFPSKILVGHKISREAPGGFEIEELSGTRTRNENFRP